MPRGRTVSVKGLDALRRKSEQLPEHIRRGAQRAVADEVEQIADDMREGAPVDTGELVEGIQVELDPDGLGGGAAATARHSIFVEQGTSKSPEQPYATPAAEVGRSRFPDRLRAELGAEIDEAVS